MEIKMSIVTFFIIICALLLILGFFTDLFPYCSLCRKIKFRAFFKIHKNLGIKPGYHENMSACKKCCSKYDIRNFQDYEKVSRIKKGIEMNVNIYKDEKCGIKYNVNNRQKMNDGR